MSKSSAVLIVVHSRWSEFRQLVAQALLVMSMESAQGRKGAFVELVGVFVGDKAEAVKEEVISCLIVMFLSRGGVRGPKMESVMPLVAVEVMTVRGLMAGCGIALIMLMGTDCCWTIAAAERTGLNPEGVG